MEELSRQLFGHIGTVLATSLEHYAWLVIVRNSKMGDYRVCWTMHEILEVKSWEGKDFYIEAYISRFQGFKAFRSRVNQKSPYK